MMESGGKKDLRILLFSCDAPPAVRYENTKTADPFFTHFYYFYIIVGVYCIEYNQKSITFFFQAETEKTLFFLLFPTRSLRSGNCDECIE